MDDQVYQRNSELAELLECHNLHQHVQGPTHTKRLTTDLILSWSDDIIKSVDMDALFPDHHVIHSLLLVAKPPPSTLISCTTN